MTSRISDHYILETNLATKSISYDYIHVMKRDYSKYSQVLFHTKLLDGDNSSSNTVLADNLIKSIAAMVNHFYPLKLVRISNKCQYKSWFGNNIMSKIK